MSYGSYSIRGLVTSPFNSGLRIAVSGISGSKLYGEDLPAGNYYVIDLGQGCVFEAMPKESAIYNGMTDAEWRKEFARRAWLDQPTEQHSKAYRDLMGRPTDHLTPWPEELYGLTAALATGRVSAQELEKGLRARGLTMPGKAINNYLGGWSFFLADDPEREIIASAFMLQCLKHRGALQES